MQLGKDFSIDFVVERAGILPIERLGLIGLGEVLLKNGKIRQCPISEGGSYFFLLNVPIVICEFSNNRGLTF